MSTLDPQELETVCFQLISGAGVAKSNYMQAIAEARGGNYEQAQALIAEGDKMQNMAHEPHANLVQREATGDPVVMTLLMTHAEDQMANSEVFRQMAVELVEVYKRLNGDAEAAAGAGEGVQAENAAE